MPRFTQALNAVLGDCIRKSDIFIVTYPKSGSYWMQCLLGNALIVKQGDDRINAQSASRYMPNLNDIAPSDPLALWRHARCRAPRVFVTHSPYDPRLLKGHVVYMLRDVRDVIVSYYYHHQKMNRAYTGTMGEYVRQTDHYPCAWDQHVRAWVLDQPGHDRVHLVRYEQLLADTDSVFTDLLTRLGVSFSQRDVDRAIEQSSFERLKQAEHKYPSNLGPLKGNDMHMRKGLVGGWRDELGADDLAVIEQRYGDVMKRMDYRLESGPSALFG